MGLVPACSRAASSLGPQRGFALPTYETHGYRDFDTVAALRDLRETGAGWVQIVPTWYQDSLASSDIRPTDMSAGTDDVRTVISQAHDEGLRVMLKPHVDPQQDVDRGQIAPVDREAWFRSYRSFIRRWASLANDQHVEQFCVGTELTSLAGERAHWLEVVADVRRVYRGPLVYAAHHYDYGAVSFWDALDLVGIDGYWPLAPRPTTDIAELERALAPVRTDLAAFAARTGRRILFTEVGFPSQVGAAVSPADDDVSTVPAQDQQAAAYRAVLSSFAGQPWWAGVFWWVWAVPHTQRLDAPIALDHSARGKQAADVVRAAWISD